jgi:hypothetical protein
LHHQFLWYTDGAMGKHKNISMYWSHIFDVFYYNEEYLKELIQNILEFTHEERTNKTSTMMTFKQFSDEQWDIWAVHCDFFKEIDKKEFRFICQFLQDEAPNAIKVWKDKPFWQGVLIGLNNEF